MANYLPLSAWLHNSEMAGRGVLSKMLLIIKVVSQIHRDELEMSNH
jgi:hypothetical protein